jgi:hypothetical protein
VAHESAGLPSLPRVENGAYTTAPR